MADSKKIKHEARTMPMCSLSLVHPDFTEIWRSLMTKEIKARERKLREFEEAYSGWCGLVCANKTQIARCSREKFDARLKARVFQTNHANEVRLVHLLIWFNKTDLGEWYVDEVRMGLDNGVPFDAYPDVCPPLEVTICKNGSEVYEPCIVRCLKTQLTKEADKWTRIRHGDKLNVRMLWCGENLPLSEDGTEENCVLPFEFKIF